MTITITYRKPIEKLLSPNYVKILSRVSNGDCCRSYNNKHRGIQTLQIACRKSGPTQSPLEIKLHQSIVTVSLKNILTLFLARAYRDPWQQMK